MKWFLLQWASVAVLVRASCKGYPCVDLEYGQFNGFKEEADGQIVDSFLGIPFAMPPVGENRFGAPQPIDNERLGSVNATRFGPQCMQFAADPSAYPGMSEDCLFLNVWRPRGVKNLPVFVWIHGGAFAWGTTSSGLYDGAELVRQSMTEQNNNRSIVVVSIAYRLNAFGFLASEKMKSSNEDAAINAGLLDQRLALQWVRKYIGKFGGNPDKITVVGESAGAMSIAAHLVSNNNSDDEPLFANAILQSGAEASKPIDAFESVFDSITTFTNCSYASPSTTIRCLRSISADALLTATVGLGLLSFSIAHDDGTYVRRSVASSLEEGLIMDVPILIGTNTDEGSLFTSSIQTDEALARFIKQFGPDTGDLIRDLYNVSAFNGSAFATASAIFGDQTFKCPVRQLADGFSAQGVQVYKYAFDMKTNIDLSRFFPSPPGNTTGAVPIDMGVSHASEMPLVFHISYLLDNPVISNVSSAIVRQWTNFAWAGVPSDIDGGMWPQYIANASMANGGGQVVRIGNSGTFTVETDDQNVEKCSMWIGLA